MTANTHTRACAHAFTRPHAHAFASLPGLGNRFLRRSRGQLRRGRFLGCLRQRDSVLRRVATHAQRSRFCPSAPAGSNGEPCVAANVTLPPGNGVYFRGSDPPCGFGNTCSDQHVPVEAIFCLRMVHLCTTHDTCFNYLLPFNLFSFLCLIKVIV